MTSLQLLLFAALAFVILFRTKMYPPELLSVNLDTDVVYRRWIPRVVLGFGDAVVSIWKRSLTTVREAIVATATRIGEYHRPNAALGEPWTIHKSALWAAIFLAVIFVIGLSSL